MIDVESTLRHGLHAYAAETADPVTMPAPATIAFRARTPEPGRRRWPKVAAIVAGGALVTTGLASAAGVLPGPVESKLHDFREWGFDATGDATMLASVTDGDKSFEVWRAPLRDGKYCVYVRTIVAGGDIENGGAASCGGSSSSWGVSFDRTGPETVETGVLPAGAVAARFTFENGTTFTAPGQTEGYFITTLAGVPYGLQILKMEAVDADGRVIGTL